MTNLLHPLTKVNPMSRPSRWSEERQAIREQASWIVRWLRDNGPATTSEIIAALETEGRDVRAHVLQRALRKSPYVHLLGRVEGERGPVSRWAWAVEEDELGDVERK